MSIDTLKRLMDDCSAEDRAALRRYFFARDPHPLESAWGVDSDTVLTAIERSSDLTKRGVRGIIAEAVFVTTVLPTIAVSGWETTLVSGDLPYDALVRKGGLSARIQIKLQRSEKQMAKLYYPKYYPEGSRFVVEVQKTRSGLKFSKKALQETNDAIETVETMTVSTRPYRFGDVDVLAVNMYPSTRTWNDFRYTVAAWLLPRASEPSMMEIFQPVDAKRTDVWTDNLAECLHWLHSGQQRSVLPEVLHKKPKA